jgi:hypothetical protein
MAWTLKVSQLSGDGSWGRNAGDTIEFIAQGDPIADNALNELALVNFVSSRVGKTSTPGVAGVGYLGPTGGNVLDHFERKLSSAIKGIWRVKAIYRDPNQTRQTGDAAFSFSTGGGTKHVSASVNGNTVGALGVSPALPDNKGLIGDKGDGNGPTGIDIDSGNFFKFKTAYYVSDAGAQAIINAILALQGPVNNSTMVFSIRGVTISCPTGSLRLEGVEGQERVGLDDWELNHHWIYSPNQTGVSVGTGKSAVNVGNVAGWDYMDIVSTQAGDMPSQSFGWAIKYVLVHQVYVRDNLNSVIPGGGIGSTPPWV